MNDENKQRRKDDIERNEEDGERQRRMALNKYVLDAVPVGRGLVLLSFVSRYESPIGLFKHEMTGLMSNFGWLASAAGKIYPVAISTV